MLLIYYNFVVVVTWGLTVCIKNLFNDIATVFAPINRWLFLFRYKLEIFIFVPLFAQELSYEAWLISLSGWKLARNCLGVYQLFLDIHLSTHRVLWIHIPSIVFHKVFCLLQTLTVLAGSSCGWLWPLYFRLRYFCLKDIRWLCPRVGITNNFPIQVKIKVILKLLTRLDHSGSVEHLSSIDLLLTSIRYKQVVLILWVSHCSSVWLGSWVVHLGGLWTWDHWFGASCRKSSGSNVWDGFWIAADVWSVVVMHIDGVLTYIVCCQRLRVQCLVETCFDWTRTDSINMHSSVSLSWLILFLILPFKVVLQKSNLLFVHRLTLRLVRLKLSHFGLVRIL